MTPAIAARGLAKRYGRRAALADLSFDLEPGACLGLLGPNGAGKSTAVKCLLGLVRPSAGTARILGAAPGDRRVRRRVGYLPELFRYPEWLAARDVLLFHAGLLGLAHADRQRLAALALERVGLAARADDHVGRFSKGMQQRLGLAVALLGDPALVVLDEPTSALDPVGRRDVRELVVDLRARGAAVVLNSHLLGEVERVCDQVLVIDRGAVVASGALDDVVGDARGVRVRTDEGWTRHDVAPDEVPALVARLVASGARIRAVVPEQRTLEERFLELLGSRA